MGLTKKQVRGIEGLIRNKTKTAAAKFAGCRRETIHGWVKQPEFMIELEKARMEALTGESEARGTPGEATTIIEALIAAGANRLGYEGLIEEGKKALKQEVIVFDLMNKLRKAALIFEREIKQAGYSFGIIVRIKRRY